MAKMTDDEAIAAVEAFAAMAVRTRITTNTTLFDTVGTPKKRGLMMGILIETSDVDPTKSLAAAQKMMDELEIIENFDKAIKHLGKQGKKPRRKRKQEKA